jgi:integrase
MNDAKFELAGYKRNVLTFRPRIEGTTKYLLDAHIPFVVDRYRYMQLAQFDAERLQAGREEIRELREWISDCLRVRREAAGSINNQVMEETVDMMLSIERLIAPPGSQVRVSLLHHMLTADIEILQEQQNRLDGIHSPTPLEEPLAPRAMPTMLDAYEAWKAKRAPSDGSDQEDKVVDADSKARKYRKVTVRTVDSYRRFVEEFESFCGALPIAGITLAHVNRYRDYLADDGLVRETVKNHLGGLAAMLRAATDDAEKFKARTVLNVFDFVDYECVRERPDEFNRRAYEVSELVKLFQSPLYTEGLTVDGQAQEAAYWVPLLSPFAGARIEELAQTRMEDIQKRNGVWVLRIANLGEDQHIKTASSFRLIPLHEEIIRCGFLAYVAKQKMAGHARVFPSLENDNKYGRWSNALGKWYSRYLDLIGLDDVRLCHHSFRFNFAQQLTACGADSRARDALMGHWLSTHKAKSKSRYLASSEKQYPFDALVSAVHSLRYEELDLSHLYVEEPLKNVEVLLEYSQDQQNGQTRAGAGMLRAKRGGTTAPPTQPGAV